MISKARLPRMIPPKQTLRLVQSSFANRYLMKARLGFAWAVTVVIRRCYHHYETRLQIST